jgi:hypothetical protein
MIMKVCFGDDFRLVYATDCNYNGSEPFGSLTLKTSTWLSRLKPDASEYLFFPLLM